MYTFVIAVAVIFGIIIGLRAASKGSDRFEKWLAGGIIGFLAFSVALGILSAVYGYFALVFFVIL